jgi:type II secretory pathway component PulF
VPEVQPGPKPKEEPDEKPEERSEREPDGAAGGEYEVASTDMHGKARLSTEKAESVESLVSRLRGDGLQVAKVPARSARSLFEPRKCSPDEFAFFSAELASACRRGAPLPGALVALSRDLSGRGMREALAGVAEDVKQGVDFADALARRSDVFPPAFVALISAGVKAGDLAGTLLIFADEARFTARIRHRFVAAIAYPLAVLFAGSLLLSLCGWYVFPRYAAIFMQLGFAADRLPLATSAALALVPAFRWAPVVVVALVVLLRLVWTLLGRGAAGSRTLAALTLHLPLVGRMVRSVALARFARALSCALTGHVPLPDAISLAGLATSNAAFVDAAEKLRKGLEEGASLSDGMAEQVGVFPATVVWMLHVSEQRGELGPALDETARLQDERGERMAEVLPVIAGTLLLMVGGMVVMGVVFSLFLPLLRLQGAL